MATMNCSSEDSYDKDGRCCNRCSAGEYMLSECDGTKATQCATCGCGYYTATKNHLRKCNVCRTCSSQNNQRTAETCTPTKNTVCECETGYYCSNDDCDHCQQVTYCNEGKGVKAQATRTTDTVCAPCKEGTYSNVTDFLSPCKTHTRCEDIGRELKIPGTKTTDAVCGDFLPRCGSWMLPAGLWSGLVLTALILFAVVICRRAKRRSRSAAIRSVPVTLVEVVPSALELPLPSTELLNGHCQESCTEEECKLPLFHPDVNLVSCSGDSSSLPITPLKASVSFVESSHNNDSAGYRTTNFLRTYSEPQEDEWCGT